MRNKKSEKRLISLLFIFVFMLSVSSFALLFTSNYSNLDADLETSTTNTLFNGKEYDITLDDVYDDENYTKIYTGANFQTVFLENESTILNETVSNVNNTNYKSPSNTDVSMIDGTFDDTDNMRLNDDSNSEFTSIEGLDYQGTYSFEDDINGEFPDDWDTHNAPTTSEVYIASEYKEHKKILVLYDNTDVGIKQVVSSPDEGTVEMWMLKYIGLSAPCLELYDSTGATHILILVFDYNKNGKIRDYQGGGAWQDISTDYSDDTWIHIRVDFDDNAHTMDIYVNEVLEMSDYAYHNNVDVGMVRLKLGWTHLGACKARYDAIGYKWDPNYNVGDNLVEPIPAELNFTIDLNFSEVDTSKLLGLDVSSYHYTNISTNIIGKIYNYESSSYTQMFSSSNTVETENYFTDDTSITDYLNPSGNLELYFTGTNENDFKQIIDYIRVRFYYKMDLTHTISFETNGLWKYRWELIGSLHYTDWTYFEVIDEPIPPSNFFAISESDQTTRWILQNSTLTSVEDFHDDINTDYWDLGDVSENIFTGFITGSSYLLDNVSMASPIEEVQYTGTHFWVGTQDSIPEGITWDGTYFWVLGLFSTEVYKYNAAGVYQDVHWDVGTEESDPKGITWDGTHFWVVGLFSTEVYKYNAAGVYQDVHWDVGAQDTIPTEIMWDGTHFWVVGASNDKVYKYNAAGVYQDVYFDVGAQDIFATGITWDGTYFWVVGGFDDEVWKYNSTGVYQDVYFDVGAQDLSPTGIIWDGTYFWVVGAYNYEVYKYEPKYNISKNYFGSGYMYMQTDTTELISLMSVDYGAHKTLSSGDYFEIDFQTSSDSQIDLLLLKDGVVNKTLTLSQSGNTNFNRHTVQISVSEELEFDQLKISSTFEDTDNVKVYDIKTYKYTIVGDYADFIVGSKRDGMPIYLTPDIYNLRIIESDIEVINENITIPETGIKQYVYTPESPISKIQCRLTLFPIDGILSLTFVDYITYVNRSYNGVYSVIPLVEPIFYADELTIVYISVYDRFDSLIGTFPEPIDAFINLEIEVYQLQIKNLMTQGTTIDINTTLYKGTLLSGDSIYFMLSKAYYQIGYYNPNNVYTQFLIYLNSNQAYELNMSRDCHIYYTNQRMEPLNFYQFKTYINGTRIITNMFYAMDGEHKGIEVKDLSDISVLNYTYIEGTGENNMFSLILTQYSLKVMSLQLCFNHINITRDPDHYGSNSYSWSEWLAPRDTAEYFLFAGYYKINITNNEDETSTYYSYTLNGDDYILIGSNNTIYNVLVNLANVNTTIGNQITNVYIDLTNQNSNINNTIINIEINLDNVNSTLGSLLIDINTAISNIETSIISEIVSLGTEINNINSSITNEILNIGVDISNLDSSIQSQFVTLGVDISNINGSIINQIVSLGVDITNINTSLSNQILSISVDISNLDTSITNQISLMIADIENVNSTIYNQTLVMLADISNVNTTLLNQIIALGVDITNVNATIINQILSLSVDLTNINSSISNLLIDLDLSITNLQNDIESFYVFTNNSFINLNNVMNTSFIYMENNIISINQSISNLVIGICNDIYFINGTISTMITQMGNNLLLMNVSINTALFDLGTTLDLIDCNITSNFILLNNSINLTNLNVNDSRIAIINNLLIINNTMSTLIANVYSAVYLVNNSIYTAVVDLGAYLSIMNNTISGNLSIVLQMNEFLTEIYQMTMFSELLNWTDIGLNITLLTSQIDAWEFINHYKNQSVEIHLRYQDLIDKLTVSAQNTIDQYLPNTGVEYREWSNELQDYIGEWKPLPENKTVNFGFFETEVPITPRPLEADFYVFMAFIIIISVISIILVISWANMKSSRDETPEDTRLRHKRKRKVAVDRRKGFYDHT